jgi:DNA replication protein
MKQFEGFPARMQFTSVPNLFFSKIMPKIDDIGELKTTLYIFRLIYEKKGYIRFVSFSELLADKGLAGCLNKTDTEYSLVLSETLNMIEARGTILRMEFEREGSIEYLYFLNTENDRKLMEKIRNGELVLDGLRLAKTPVTAQDTGVLPDIFTLFEENVGMLTPMIADWLKEAEKQYPEAWIRDAIREAVSLNKRNWRYIDRILENWSAEGRDDGTHRGNSKTDTAKYGRQKYGHMVRR